MPKDNKKIQGFSDEEKAAMKERARESMSGKADGEVALLSKIAEMPEPDRSLATKVHEIIKRTAPNLNSKTWYGMPAYANKEGKVICFFQNASKFKYRYATLGFSDLAKLDEGSMWPTTYALMKIGKEEEMKIVELVKKAIA